MNKLINKIRNIGADKWLHFIAGFSIAQIVTNIACKCTQDYISAFAIGVIIAYCAGMLKELWDGRKDKLASADSKDFFFTACGALYGELLYLI